MRIAVLYIARGLTGGMTSIDAFLESYRTHPAGCPHTLYLLAKGWDGVAGYDALSGRASEIGARMLNLPDDGFDWGAYMRAARLVDEDWICCLNTHSRILHDGWLAALANAAQLANVGCSGCTGSWGTIALVPKFIIPIARDVGVNEGRAKGLTTLLILVAKFPFHWALRGHHFPPFPNPHLRSNAFLILRDRFLAFAANFKIPTTKHQAWQLESGRMGLTRYIAGKGQSVVVAGADGRTYFPDQWINAATFRIPDQANLLIADNQTNSYVCAPRNLRRLMELSAWGKFFSP